MPKWITGRVSFQNKKETGFANSVMKGEGI